MKFEAAKKLVNKEIILRIKCDRPGIIGELFAGKVVDAYSRSYGDFILMILDIGFGECKHLEINIKEIEWYRGVK